MTLKTPPSLFIHVTKEELDQILSLRDQVHLQVSESERRESLFVAYLVHFLGLDKEWVPRLLDPEEHWQLLCDENQEALKQRVSTIH